MERIIWQVLEWWLLRRLPGAAAGPVIGDLLEEHAVKRGRVGSIRATIWLLNQSLSIAIAYRPQMRAAAHQEAESRSCVRIY